MQLKTLLNRVHPVKGFVYGKPRRKQDDSAANGFFFNLADNSANLDNQNGGFTVFGQIISGSNVLQYFNTLSKPIEGIFDETSVNTNGQALSDLPVNNHNWSLPANSNLFFGDSPSSVLPMWTPIRPPSR